LLCEVRRPARGKLIERLQDTERIPSTAWVESNPLLP